MRIDSHQHFWKYDPIKHSWMQENMGVIKNDFLPEHLEPLLKASGLDACVAVQASQTVEENNFLIDLASKNSILKGIVGWVDLQAENIEERLIYYKQFSIMKGFRHVLHDEPEIGYMHQPAFKAGLHQLSKLGFTYDLLIFPEHLPNAIKLVKEFPNLRFVIDHIAKPRIKEQEVRDWKANITKIAAFENVYCKVSGMVTEADWYNWQKKDFDSYLKIVVEAFGTKRIMYGSDWPVCTLAAQYKEQFAIVNDYFATFSKEEQNLFWGGNATIFYGL